MDSFFPNDHPPPPSTILFRIIYIPTYPGINFLVAGLAEQDDPHHDHAVHAHHKVGLQYKLALNKKNYANTLKEATNKAHTGSLKFKAGLRP